MYVIMKGQLFVSISGSNASYTNDILKARKFKSKEDAERNKCGNETVKNIYNLL